MLLQMEEPPEMLAENAFAEHAPEPEPERVARFLEAAAAAGEVQPGKKAGTYKLGRKTVAPEDLLEDFAAVTAEVQAYRKLVRGLADGPELCRARLVPKVKPAEAKKELGAKPEHDEVLALVGLFDIQVAYFNEKQVAGLFAIDVGRGKRAPELLPGLADAVDAKAEPLGADELPAKPLAKALDMLKEEALHRAEGLYKLVRTEVARARAERKAAMEGFFEGLDEEYAKEERRMYYHLYYFDQQEKLKARRAADLVERQKLVEGEERFDRIESSVRPDGLALLALPVYRAGKRRLCGLSGRTL